MAAPDQEHLEQSEYDVIVVGTGLVESVGVNL